MKRIKNVVLKTIVLTCSIVLVAGCASLGQPESDEPDIETFMVQYVSRDFLSVYTQLLPPRETTVQLGKPSTVFGKELEEGFKETGYGIQRVGADQGPFYMTYSENTKHNSDNRKTYTYKLDVGDLGLERTYINVKNAGVFPAGPMMVYGTTKNVELNPDLFKQQGSQLAFVSEVQYEKRAESASDTVPKITLVDEDLIRGILEKQDADLPSYKALNSQNIAIENLYSRGESNFQSVDIDYRTVRKDVIIFGDDSLRLRERGKDQITRLAGFFNANTDLFRLVGCSNGPTKHEGGNEALALGRSKRVAEALLSQGVKQSSILDEGCWAPVSHDEFPARGVLVELKRRT